MRTLTLQEAARLLHIHPITLLRKAQSGEVPAAKPGKCWVFIDIDLVDYLRSNYRRQASKDSVRKEANEWLSIDLKSRRSGGLTSPSADDEYAKALGLKTGEKLRNTTTS
jgi:excisionase family DNA binding protein